MDDNVLKNSAIKPIEVVTRLSKSKCDIHKPEIKIETEDVYTIDNNTDDNIISESSK